MRFALRHLIAAALLAGSGAQPGLAQDPDVPQEPSGGSSVLVASDAINAAKAALRSRNYEDAIRLASTAVRDGRLSAPRLALALRLRGAAYLNTNRPERAQADFNAALRIEPRDVVGLLGRGAALLVLARAADARADFDRALTLRRVPVLYYWRGLARVQLRDFRGALDDFDDALALQPRYAPAYYGRGLAYHALGQGVRARDDYERALAIDPTFAAARGALDALRARRPAPLAPALSAPARNGVVQF